MLKIINALLVISWSFTHSSNIVDKSYLFLSLFLFSYQLSNTSDGLNSNLMKLLKDAVVKAYCGCLLSAIGINGFNRTIRLMGEFCDFDVSQVGLPSRQF